MNRHGKLLGCQCNTKRNDARIRIMINRCARICPVLIVIMLMIFAGAAWSQESVDTEVVDTEVGDITAESVEESLQTLTADGEYEYEEDRLDEPEWLLALQEWLNDLGQRWRGGPVSFLNRGGFAMFGLILVIVLALLVLLFILIRLFGRSYESGIGGRRFEGEMEITGKWGESGAEKATELASTGNYREAVSVLFRATLAGLDSLGWIRYRKSNASRQYLRQLRRSAELYPVFRDLLWKFEVAYYRKDTPDSEDWSFMYDRYKSLVEVATSIRPPAYMRRTAT